MAASNLRHPIRVVIGIALGAFLASPAAAQEVASNFDQLRFKVGQDATVWITDRVGAEVKARVIEVAGPNLLVLLGDGTRRTFTEADVTRIRQRMPDSLWTGALIGLAAGATLGALAASFSEDCSYSGGSACYGPAVSAGLIGTGVGVGIDALIKGRKTIYEGPAVKTSVRFRLAPHVSSTTRAVRFIAQF